MPDDLGRNSDRLNRTDSQLRCGGAGSGTGATTGVVVEGATGAGCAVCALPPPHWDVCDKKYVFDLSGPNGAALDATAACPARGSDTLMASLSAKEAADDAAFKTLTAQMAARNAKDAAAAQAAADADAAAKARGEAIGGFIGGLFGGGSAQTAQTAPVAPSTTTTVVAPVPVPAPPQHS